MFKNLLQATPKPLTVSEVNLQVKSLLERDAILEDLWVAGEVSNLSLPASGHAYFTLKDAKGSLKCVMWRGSLSAYRADLVNGNALEVHGKIGVYERDGIYQLYADKIRHSGMGNLFEKFIRLKEKLESEGLFNAERKKELPIRPLIIGVVTSPSGAALQDIINTLGKRWPMCELWLSPASVQGAEAPKELHEALSKLINARPDVILIARGGGSLEDLWAFNDEALVRLTADSPIPIVSGIGHETDFTLVDFAADRRAPTPTGAAMLVSPDIQEIRMDVADLQNRLFDRMELLIGSARQYTKMLTKRLEIQSPMSRIEQEKKSLSQLSIRLKLQANTFFTLRREQLSSLNYRLDSVAPNQALKRGYTMITSKQGEIITSVAQTRPGDEIELRFHDGSADAKIL